MMMMLMLIVNVDDDDDGDEMATCLPMGKLGNLTKLLFLALAAVSIWQHINLGVPYHQK